MLAKINPTILPASLAVTSLIFGSASVYAYMQPKDSLLSWGKSLQGALFGIIGLQLSGLIANMSKPSYPAPPNLISPLSIARVARLLPLFAQKRNFLFHQ